MLWQHLATLINIHYKGDDYLIVQEKLDKGFIKILKLFDEQGCKAFIEFFLINLYLKISREKVEISTKETCKK